ncbi:MAG: dihydropteroate synthase [Bdellovibrionota bacterium]
MSTPLAALTSALRCGPPWIAGVLNVTPDSFSDGGDHLEVAHAIVHGAQLIADGANIIDIGGEATGPGSQPVSAEVEIQRIDKVVRSLGRSAFLSIDTYKSQTAEHCLAAGARMINDISGLRADPDLARTVAKHDAFLVIMYSKQTGTSPHVDNSARAYSDVVQEISEFLLERAAYAEKQGVSREKIILDPGMGRYVSERAEDSWELLARMSELVHKTLPYPIFLGTSRKGFLGGRLSERDPLSQLTATIAVERGVSIIRTHNVKMAKDFFGALHRLSPAPGGKPTE